MAASPPQSKGPLPQIVVKKLHLQSGAVERATNAVKTAGLETEWELSCPESICAGTVRYGLEPSIINPGSTASTQYLLGKRYATMGAFSCSSYEEISEGVWDFVFHSGFYNVTWKIADASFGGHEAQLHSNARPTGKFTLNADAGVGHYTVPATSATPLTYTRTFTTAESEQMADGLAEGLVFALPEVAQETEMVIQFGCEGELLFAVRHVPRTEMNTDLVRVSDTTSGQAILNIERVTNSHGDRAGYATPLVASRLNDLIANYGQCDIHQTEDEAEHFPLWVTAISLPKGGIYDINKNWAVSHRAHRAGENVDIGFSSVADESLGCLYLAITNSGFTMPVPGERLIQDAFGNISRDGSHAHLWSGETHVYPLDQTYLNFDVTYE